MRFVAALLFAAPLFGQCTYSLDKTTISVPSTASTAGTTATTVSVTATPAACRWLPNVTAGSWLHLSQASQQIQTGSGTFAFSTDANPIGQTRTGTITVQIEGTLFPFVTITQDAATCSFNFSPASQNFSVNGGTGAVNVTANCAWAVANSAGAWLQIPSQSAGGITSATVPFSVSANPCLPSRSGSITMSGSGLAKSLSSSVTQDGSPSNFSLSATSATADATASDNRFQVNTGTGCGWSATSDVSWMQIISGAGGAGNGNISYHLIANTSAARTGTIHVNPGGGAQFTYTVTQAAPGPPSPTIASVADAANYAADAISPGEIVTIFGQNLGPDKLVPLQITGGLLSTNLGGTQVLFDGVAAPMIYSVKGQVSAVAPYGLAGKDSTKVQVSYNGATSDPMTVTVQDSHPAIFTLDASGLGGGAILNQDNSVNSIALPAARGSVVAIYCTGGGTMNPAVIDGSVVGATLPHLTLPVSVTIGGIDAKVEYAGGVPQSIAGLVQINVDVPANIATGSKVPIVVKVGAVTSSAGVTIAVK
jgi:uncharacterized protein (TIGR03437 family)